MGSDQESAVRSFHKCYAAGDRAAALSHYADDAIWHVAWWREPRVGRDAIQSELDRQFDALSGYRSEVVNMLSQDAIVFVEGIDTLTRGADEVTIHWSSVFEINAEGKIARQRDYWDTRELETQLT